MDNLWIIYLVGGDWNMTYMFPFSWEWNVIIPIDELIFFGGVNIPPTRINGTIPQETVKYSGTHIH